MDEMKTWFVPIAVALLVFAGGQITGRWEYASRERETDVKMVEIAAALLGAPGEKPASDPALRWAVDVINIYSKVPLTLEAAASPQWSGAMPMPYFDVPQTEVLPMPHSDESQSEPGQGARDFRFAR